MNATLAPSGSGLIWEIHAESLTVSTPIVVTVTRGSATALNVEIDLSLRSSRPASQLAMIKINAAGPKIFRMVEIVLQKAGTHFCCSRHQSPAPSDWRSLPL
jgi:hypothetical protein